jgi:phospholipase C
MTDQDIRGRDRERIKHIVVLMMENRSFDHLVGFLDHDNPHYPRLDHLDVSCLVDPRQPGGRRVSPAPDASAVLGTDPDHSHEAVMVQMFGRAGTPGVGEPTMSGFIESYREKIDGPVPRPKSWWQKAVGAVTAVVGRIWRGVTGGHGPVAARPDDIMRCFRPAEIPVLGFLAKQYGVLVDWHASVPGETWPNRQYAHAATSHGTSDIKVGFYPDETVFERLSEAGRTWSIYVDGVAQVWAYPKLWTGGLDHFHDMDQLMRDIAAGTLPDYTFIEPNHGFGPGDGNSQHPGNNTLKGDSFAAGEALIARVYNALVANPALFAETLLLITYDEHGGFFDHVPAKTVAAPDLFTDPANGFDFTLSGVRVPAVAVSPLIPAGTVDETFYEHAAIPAAVLAQFVPGGKPLTGRDAKSANLLAQLPLLPAPRTDVRPVPLPPTAAARGETTVDRQLNDFQSSLVKLAGGVHNALAQAGRPHGFAVAAEPRMPDFVPEASTSAAAGAGVLPPGSQADRLVRAVVEDFVRETPAPA